ncbi:hypothetical protein CHLRE_17g725800v5 [Chlamydomonas reinhardtii]|uniref:Uncharacterized protein n=1 Tax=Chlamydomonas reinhardtii TaxID=3055 RepID=A0A2K3CQM6_CHLRE|nr:uncharacterized protein CHLRE_17g725800v5 [Chlamydomonas reinhardtii]PNW70581.1 hypothetical protein CHLRE_17g725800v5 [Chlamydomonas reinhardtii]
MALYMALIAYWHKLDGSMACHGRPPASRLLPPGCGIHGDVRGLWWPVQRMGSLSRPDV